MASSAVPVLEIRGENLGKFDPEFSENSVDLDEQFSGISNHEYDPDPEPGGPREDVREGSAYSSADGPDAKVIPLTDAKSMRGMQREIAAELEVWLLGLAMVWGISDPYCADVLEQRAKRIAGRLAKLLMRWPKVAERMVAGGALTDTLMVLREVKDVGKAMYDHHIRHSVGDDGTELPGSGNPTISLSDYPPYAGG